MGFVRKIGRKIDDYILQPIKENPIGAIVSVGGMALGIPPVYAGALGGAAGAAASGGNVLEGALVGGVAGYAGGAAGGAAARAGASSALAGAAGGAAAGAAGAALTGGNIIRGALTGGALGGISGYVAGEFLNNDNSYTRTYDDGSVIRYDSNGNILEVMPATDSGSGAPVYEWNPSTRQMELVSGNGSGALNVLDANQTAELLKNVDPNLINSLDDTGAFRVEVSGLPGTAENPGYAKSEYRTPGTELATFEQIDSGAAQWNPAANAWEVGAPGPSINDMGTVNMNVPAYQGPEVYTFDDGSTLTINADGTVTSTDAIGTIDY